ncbi:GNAT family N-acetyltransferase [Phytobacter ursingii]
MQYRNSYGQCLGQEMQDWTARSTPEKFSLSGNYCMVTPLSVDHAEDLFHAWQSIDDDRDWTYLPGKRPATKEACYNYFRELIGAKNGMHMSVIDKNDDTVKGIFCITRINPIHGTFELTDINWTPALKKTRISTEAIYLVLAYFFDALHYRRCEWRTNIFNDGAIKAAERFGFRKEGILRDKKVTKGHSEDLALFSIIASEWHDLEVPIKAWLRENNFDGLGRQLKKLKDFR